MQSTPPPTLPKLVQKSVESCLKLVRKNVIILTKLAKEKAKWNETPTKAFSIGSRRICASRSFFAVQDRSARRGMEFIDEFRATKKANGWPDLSMEEIDAEIAAARRERRERKAREANCEIVE